MKISYRVVYNDETLSIFNNIVQFFSKSMKFFYLRLFYFINRERLFNDYLEIRGYIIGNYIILLFKIKLLRFVIEIFRNVNVQVVLVFKICCYFNIFA